MSVDSPTEPNELSKSIRAILNEELANLYLGSMNGDEIEKQESYKGDLANGNLVIEKYCKDNFAYLKSQMKDLKEADPRANANMGYDIRLNKEAETDSYVTSTFCLVVCLSCRCSWLYLRTFIQYRKGYG